MPKTTAPQSVEVITLDDPASTNPTSTVQAEPAAPTEDFRRGDDPTTAAAVAAASNAPVTDATAAVAAPAPTHEYRTLVVVNYGPAGEEQRYESNQPIHLSEEAAAPLLAMRAIERVTNPPDKDAM